VYHRELEVGEPRREQDTDRCFGHEQDGHEGFVLEAPGRAQNRDQEHIDIEKQSPHRDRKVQERRPFARVDGFARADAAAQLADHADLVERQVEADEDPGQRQRGHDHPLGHFVFFGAAGGAPFASGELVVFATESTMAFMAS
jgi:hypothetical protein